MNIAVGSDMKTHLTDVVVAELEKRGYGVDCYGALVKEVALWPEVAIEVAEKSSCGQLPTGDTVLLDRNRD